MTATEATDPTPAPAIGQALQRVANPRPASPYCVCGRCLAGDDYSYNERALDACMSQILDVLGILHANTPHPHPGYRMALRVLHEIVANARVLLCVQRQTTRALASLKG